MGLDQYAYAYPKELVGEMQTDLQVEAGNLLHQWRKHPDLDDWMEAQYWSKGGDREIFNCAAVRLDSEDLDELEQTVKDNALPKSPGVHYGSARPEAKADDLAFIAKARAAIAQGLVVFYHCWW